MFELFIECNYVPVESTPSNLTVALNL